MKKISIILAVGIFSACSQNRYSNISGNYTVQQPAVDSYASATKEFAVEAQKCKTAFIQQKLKSNYEMGKCIDDAMQKNLSIYYANKRAFSTAKDDLLLLMIQLDKKQVTEEEAGLLGKKIMDKLDDAEAVTKAAINQQDQQERQQEAAQARVAQEVFSQMFQQPKPVLQCNTINNVIGSNTTCY